VAVFESSILGLSVWSSTLDRIRVGLPGTGSLIRLLPICFILPQYFC